MKKKIWILMTVIFLVLTYGVIFYNMQDVHLNIDHAARITVFSGGTGKTVEVTEEEAIQRITDDFNHATFERGKSSKNYEGYAYMLTWLDAEGNIIKSVAVMSADRISYKNRFLLVKKGTDGIEMQTLAESFES